MPQKKPSYKRILLKLSGESLLGENSYGIDLVIAKSIARELKEIHDSGVEIAVMIGGGNIFRGTSGAEAGMDRASADYMGLLATVMNGIALQDAMEKEGMFTRHISAIEIKAVAEPFVRRRVIRHLEKGRIVIFSAGIGSPYFTTDTAAALRALEMKAQIILKATKVDGVYSADPFVYPDAKFFDHLSYQEVIDRELQVMDMAAFCLCRDHNMPIRVFNMNAPGIVERIILGSSEGTLID